MAKQAGMGDNFFIAGYNLSGDVGSLGSIAGGPALQEVTGIDKSAIERLGTLRTGQIEFNTFFNDAALAEHPALSTLPTTDVHCMYLRGTTLGNPAAAMVCKQINYDGTRAADGAFTFGVQAQSNAYGLEWGRTLTAGVRTLTGASGGLPSIDTAASLSFGGQAYLQVFSFTGTDATVLVQDSADDSAFATIASLSFAQTTAAPTTQRVATTNTTTLRRYLRLAVTTVGGVSNISFAVTVVKNEIAGQLF